MQLYTMQNWNNNRTSRYLIRTILNKTCPYISQINRKMYGQVFVYSNVGYSLIFHQKPKAFSMNIDDFQAFIVF